MFTLFGRLHFVLIILWREKFSKEVCMPVAVPGAYICHCCTLENILLISSHLDPVLLCISTVLYLMLPYNGKKADSTWFLFQPPKDKCLAAAVGRGHTFGCLKVNSTNCHLGVSFTCGGKYWGQSRQGAQLWTVKTLKNSPNPVAQYSYITVKTVKRKQWQRC